MEYYLLTIKAHLLEIGAKIISGSIFKVPIAFVTSAGLFLIGPQNGQMMTALLILILIDMVTAIMAQFKLGKEIESRKALKTATKTVVYGLFVSGAHLTETIVPGGTFIDNAAISFLALTELISIIENVGHMGYAIPKKMLNKLQKLRDKE